METAQKTAVPLNGAAEATPRKPVEQIVVREFPQIGKYKVRIVQKSARDRTLILDVREYAKSATFEGFTRRGIRLLMPAEAAQLFEHLRSALAK